MAKQKIAQTWKMKYIGYNAATAEFQEKESNLGSYTAATIKEKISAKYPSFRFTPKPYHGFGGYWVHENGDTVEVLPTYK